MIRNSRAHACTWGHANSKRLARLATYAAEVPALTHAVGDLLGRHVSDMAIGDPKTRGSTTAPHRAADGRSRGSKFPLRRQCFTRGGVCHMVGALSARGPCGRVDAKETLSRCPGRNDTSSLSSGLAICLLHSWKFRRSDLGRLMCWPSQGQPIGQPRPL